MGTKWNDRQSDFVLGSSRVTPLATPLIILILLFPSTALVAGAAGEELPQAAGGANASLVIGQVNFTAKSGVAARSGLEGPLSLCFDPNSNLWVSDVGNNRVLEFKPPFANGMNASLAIGQASFTTSATRISQNALSQPAFVACDGLGNIWVADEGHNRILEFESPFANGINASVVIGQSDFATSSAATTRSGLHGPNGIAFDQSGNLWVSDTVNNRVLEFKPPFANGMNASLAIGQANFTASTPETSQSGLYYPEGVTIDSSGNLWFSDNANRRVLEFNPPFSDGMNASLVIGQAGFTSGRSGNTNPTSQNMEGPIGLTFDSSGNLWVADINYDRVLKFKAPFSIGMETQLVLGQSNLVASLPDQVGPAGLSGPTDVAFDSSDNLWVADYHNNRILEFQHSSLVAVGNSGSPSTSVTFGWTTYFIVAVAAVTVFGLAWFALYRRRRYPKKTQDCMKRM